MFADFFLQTPMMLETKGRYIHMGRAVHCAIHSVGTAVVLLFFGLSTPVFLALLIAEWLLHYHIDFGKARWSENSAHTPQDAAFWRGFGVDQALHQLTYVGMVALLA